MSENKKKILVVCDYYLPGCNGGGGLRTIVNTVERLGDRYDFWIVTRGHDGRYDKTPYTTVNIGEWNNVGKANVFYLHPDDMKIARIRALVEESAPDAIYLNSFFATPANFILFLRSIGRVRCPVIMAPCGEFAVEALQAGYVKKKAYIQIAKLLGLYKGLYWKATTELEKIEIENALGKKDRMYIAADLPPQTIFPEYEPSLNPVKVPGELKLTYMSRIVKKKNFAYLPDLFDNMPGHVTLDVIGYLEDEAYWAECQEKMKSLPANVTFNYVGLIDNSEVPQKLTEYHFLIIPTLNENFGHIFIESLASGCPLIISDRTPWLNLAEKNAGWDLPLENKELWSDTLRKCVEMDDAEYRKLCAGARAYALEWLADESLEANTVAVLDAALAGS